MAQKIIQWNCRGLRSNYNDLAILLQEHSPTAVCLQETNLKPNTNISFKGFVKNQHTVGVFFDLEKAYDTTWKGGIMKDLHEMGLKGRLPLFIDNFLKGRIWLDNEISLFKQ